MKDLKPKKYLGQHFLKDSNISKKISESLISKSSQTIIEIGPGMGILTQHLISKKTQTYFVELDQDSIFYLNKMFPKIKKSIIHSDFLKIDLTKFNSPIGLIGNFPYNISSQILFKMIENRDRIDELVGMFQLEVAKRVCSKPGSKTYGILSVLVQAFYNTELLFELDPSCFNPPPKVDSGVIRLNKKKHVKLDCDESLFFKVVKISFQQRRKTLRNSLKKFNIPNNIKEGVIFGKRPETLCVNDFILLTNIIADGTIPA
ncbi:MAG: 16S rRNA (adenine(1518)-N(6)/adenine(1519)-N(6))-dimethyltransferase RsmA [Flavobacteriaceae bacterium]|nr:16S rRNA (adenine(1518)-N(6)/adenine(1519)-N(6))-dimethyltransferase RsmA [Flavobacteriaceae bacterium]